MKTFEQIVKDISRLKWSTVVLEDSFSEVEESIKLAIKQANSYLFGLKDFPFRIKKGAAVVNAGTNAFIAPTGNITLMWIENTRNYLNKLDNGDLLEPKTAKPENFWIEYGDKGANVYLYPTPDQNYSVLYKYVNSFKARDMAGNEKANLEESTDVVNLPDDPVIEDLYLHCLYMKSMVYLIADEQDENYAPYEKEFMEAYRNLLNVTGMSYSPRIVI